MGKSRELTRRMSTPRKIPAIMTKIAPEKSTIRLNFLIRGRRAPQSIGTGIRMRYVSVATLRQTVRRMYSFETAGWHKLPGSGLICQKALKG